MMFTHFLSSYLILSLIFHFIFSSLCGPFPPLLLKFFIIAERTQFVFKHPQYLNIPLLSLFPVHYVLCDSKEKNKERANYVFQISVVQGNIKRLPTPNSWMCYLRKNSFTLHLSHKDGKSSSEVKFFCNLLYIPLKDLSTCTMEHMMV